MRKKLIAFLCVVMVLMSIPNFAFAEQEEYTGEFRKISTDGTWEVNSIKPKNASESSTLISILARDFIDTANYYGHGICSRENFDPEKAEVTVYSYESLEPGQPVYNETHDLQITYNEPDKEIVNAVENIAEKMKIYSVETGNSFDNAYYLEDMNLINYFFTSKNPYFSQTGTSPDLAMNYTEDIMQATGGANVYVKMDVRAGGSNNLKDACFIQDVVGPVAIYYNGMPCYVTDESQAMSFVARNVLYVPDDADNYMEAAKERLASYLGEGNFSISLGGTLESLSYEDEFGNIMDFNSYEIFDESKLADDNYYKITLNGNEFDFILYKVPKEEIKEPTFMGMNLESGITVYSNDTLIPLDTAVSTERVQSEQIKEAVKTDKYVAYDISLFSRGADRSIEKATNGGFSVHMPIPADLMGKDLTVYHVDDNGKSTEYEVSIENGYAVFNTDHFSTYVLA